MECEVAGSTPPPNPINPNPSPNPNPNPNPNYLVIEHPITRCVLCVNALWVGLWKYVPPNPNSQF